MKNWLVVPAFILIGCGAAQPQGPPDPLARGNKIYQTRCRTCHQSDGSGTIRNNRFAANFTDPKGVLTRDDAVLTQSIMNGLEGRYGRMPAFRPILSEDDVTQVLAYIRANFSPKETTTPEAIAE